MMKEKIKLYGIIDEETREWIIDSDGRIILYPSRPIAQEKTDYFNSLHRNIHDWLVGEIEINLETDATITD